MLRRLCFAFLVCSCFPAVSWGQGDLTGGTLLRFLARATTDFSQARSLPYQSGDQAMFENVIANGKHYSLLTRWNRTSMVPILLHPLTTVEIPEWSGSWSGITPVITDPPDDAEPGLPGTDWSALYMAHDNAYMYFKLDLDAYPAQRCTFAVDFLLYLNQRNTPGDLTAETIFADGEWHTYVWGNTGPDSANLYAQHNDQSVHAETGHIQWRVPTASLRYQAGTAFRPGIENRFLVVTIWGEPDSGAPNFRDGGPDVPYLPMIVNFPPPPQ